MNDNILKAGGGHGSVVKPACLESGRSRVGIPLWPESFKETKCFFPAHSYWFNIAGNLGDREVACSASDRRDSNFESCAWRAVSCHSSHHPQEVLLAQFSLYIHKRDLKPHSCHFILKLPDNVILRLCTVVQSSYYLMGLIVVSESAECLNDKWHNWLLFINIYMMNICMI